MRGRFAKNDDFGEARRQASSNHEDDDDDQVSSFSFFIYIISCRDSKSDDKTLFIFFKIN